MKLLDLFSGIGGFSLAAHRRGWETAAFVEWDSYCQEVLAKNFPGVPIYGDIREVNKTLELIAYEKTTTDIITGGFPCQPFSLAGQRKGKEDDRYLWPEMLRTIQVVRPRWIVGENVAGLVSMENGETLDRILTDLEAEGYHTETFLIPASGVGAWHRRDRVWIVGHASEQRLQDGGGAPVGEQRKVTESERSGSTWSEDVPNSLGIGTQRFRPGGKQEPSTHDGQGLSMCSSEGAGSTTGQSQSRLGGMVNGTSGWIHEYTSREPEGIPRVTTEKRNRVQRLKALGNAIYWPVAYEIFKAIDLFENSRDKDL